MGATDNAFIRIFDDGHSTERLARSRSHESTDRVRAPHIAVAPSAVSQVYAGMTDSPPVTLPLPPVSTSESVVESSDDGSFFILPAASREQEVVAASAQSTRRRLDAAPEVATRGHHIKSSAFQLAAAATVDTQHKTPGIALVRVADDDLSPATRAPIDNAARVIAAVDDGAAPASPLAGSPSIVKPADWLPDWEVDQFRWPSVCERLAQNATGALSRIVRPLLTEAWKGQNVVAVTSFSQGEGVTTVALAIARMAASYNVSVALVEGDLENSTIGQALGVAHDGDWNDGPPATHLKSAAIGSLQDKLVVLPLKRPGTRNGGDPSTHRSADDRARMLFELSDAFELVIIDAGPMFTAAYRWFCETVGDTIDRALLVRDVRTTTAAQLDDACARLSHAGLPAVAVVENFSTETSPRSGN